MPFDKATYEDTTFTLEGLIAWLEMQPGETKYDYCRPNDCLLCRYFRAMGVDVFSLDIRGYITNADVFDAAGRWPRQIPYPQILADVANPPNPSGRSTYGAALDRARALVKAGE